MVWAIECELTVINLEIFEETLYRKCLWCPYRTSCPSRHKTGLSYEGLQRGKREEGQSGISRFYVLLEEIRAEKAGEEKGAGREWGSPSFCCYLMRCYACV